MKKIVVVRIVLVVLIILWTYVIFSFSGHDGNKSSGISFKISMFLTRNCEKVAEIIEPYIRKLAHFSEYGVGAILFYLFLYTFNKITLKLKNIISVIITIIYSISDEIHQLYVPQRAGRIVDVYIDTLGIITGVLFVNLIILIINNLKSKKEGEIYVKF